MTIKGEPLRLQHWLLGKEGISTGEGVNEHWATLTPKRLSGAPWYL